MNVQIKILVLPSFHLLTTVSCAVKRIRQALLGHFDLLLFHI